MITILIAEDEVKAKETWAKIIAQGGSVLSQGGAGDKIIRALETGGIYKSVVEAVERPLIEQALERTEGNQLKAARILGINRNTMRAKIKKLGIDVKKWKAN